MVSKDHELSQRRQCTLLQLSRSTLYYQPKGESAENLRFMEIIDKQFLETPWYGSRQMARYMQRKGHKCGRHRVRRLMRLIRRASATVARFFPRRFATFSAHAVSQFLRPRCIMVVAAWYSAVRNPTSPAREI